MGRGFRVWAPFAYVLTVLSCAQIVGLTGDYQEGSEPAGGAAGDHFEGGGGQGGTSPGGQAGEGGMLPPTGGDAGDAGSAGAGSGGDAGGGGTEPGGGGTAGGGARGGGTGGGGTGGGGTGGGATGGMAGAGDGGTGGEATGGNGGSGGTVVGPPSCGAGLATCGPDGTSDCCASIALPEGTYLRSNQGAYPASVNAFRLDTYEATVARFRKFEAEFATGYRPSVGDGDNPSTTVEDGWESAFTAELPANRSELRASLACYEHQTWTDTPGDNEDRPINCTTLYVAFAFCIWDGGWLPTEAEWNYAAAGGDDQRVYPWSVPSTADEIDIDHASYDITSNGFCGGDGNDGCAVTDLVRPGSRPDGDGRWGHADLAGNAAEWVRDRNATYANPCVNCVAMQGDGTYVVRGGCYSNYFRLLQTDFRLSLAPKPGAPGSGMGIRCARPI